MRRFNQGKLPCLETQCSIPLDMDMDMDISMIVSSIMEVYSRLGIGGWRGFMVEARGRPKV